MKRLILMLVAGCMAAANVNAAELGEWEVELAQSEAELARQNVEFALQGIQLAQVETEIEARMDEARRELDKAARQLAEASREAYEKDRSEHGNKPVIGVLLTGSGDSDGLLLEGVTPDGGAVEAGLQAGDRLIAINGERLDGEGEKPLKRLNKVLKTATPGDTVQLEYVRDETVFLADVVTQGRQAHVTRMLGGLDGLEIEMSQLVQRLSGLSEIGELAELSALSALENFDGLHVQLLDGNHTMAIVGNQAHLVDVDEGLGAYFGVDNGVLVVNSSVDSELESGDILLEVAGDEVTTVAEAYKAFGKAEGDVEARVKRKKRERAITIAASEFPQVRYFPMNGTHGLHKRVIRIDRHGDDDVDVRIIIDDD